MNKGYTPTKSEEEFRLIESRHKIMESFLKGASDRFEEICPETLIMLDYLNNKNRSIKDIQADLTENDNLCLKIREVMKKYGLDPEENPDFDLRELGINDKISTTFREVAAHGNALYIELVISQFSYYVEKLNKLNYKKFDDFLEDMLAKEKNKSA